jgi:hypothetical protein
MAKILSWTSCERGAALRCTEEVDQASALTIRPNTMAKEERHMAQYNAERLDDTRQQYCLVSRVASDLVGVVLPWWRGIQLSRDLSIR